MSIMTIEEVKVLKIKHDKALKELQLKQNEEKIRSELEDQQNKLIEGRAMASAREKVLRGYEKDYSFCPSFISQLEYFEKHYDNWINAKDLDYKTERELLFKISTQYDRCLDGIRRDIRSDSLGFYNKFNDLAKRVSKLEKMVKK